MTRLVTNKFPRTFAGLFAKPLPRLEGLALPLRVTVRLVEQLYLEKIHEDRCVLTRHSADVTDTPLRIGSCHTSPMPC